MPTLYIIDAFAQFFRNYHAIRTPMSSPVTKEPTNMTFGFVGMLLKLLKAEGPNLSRAGQPDFIVVATDVSDDRGTFRSQIYPEYKANRPPPPEDLLPQVDRCLKIMSEIGIPIVGAAGFEADDVIATLVTRLRKEFPDLRIRLASKDKDLKQLLEGGGTDTIEPIVELFDIQTDTPYDAAKLFSETGITPGQVIDMLALMGDTVDNVPGVPGVGEKTASLLIKEYGSIDNLLEKAGGIKGKRGENIRAAAATLPLSRTLVTLRHDVPVEFDLDSARASKFKLSNLLPILKELGFNRYQDEVRLLLGEQMVMPVTSVSERKPGGEHRNDSGESGLFGTDAATAATPGGGKQSSKGARSARDSGGFGGLFDSSATSAREIKAQSGQYRCIKKVEELAEFVDQMRTAEVISIDTETTGLSPLDAKLCGVCLSIKSGTGVYIPIRSPNPDSHLNEEQVLRMLRPLLEDETRPKCGHNLKYDLNILRSHGVSMRGLSAQGSCDSMVASYLIDASRSSHGLDSLALAMLGRTNISIKELIGTGKDQRTFDTVPLEQATQYAAEDADVALQLREAMLPQLRAMNLMPLMHEVEMPLVEVLAELEYNGILVDPAELDRQRKRLSAMIEEILAKLNSESIAALGRKFDPDSPKQLSAALFNTPDVEPPGLGIKPVKKTKTGYSTDAEVLEKLGEDDSITAPIPRLILEYRQLTKLVSTYLVALKDAIHPRTKRIHSSFNQTVAATGRLASSDPNLQNIPIRTDIGREIRRAFIAPPGSVLITADYSQIELRLLAHLSRDPALIDAFHAGEDIHTAVAAQIHNVHPSQVTREQRGGAKMVNFGIVYGITAYGLARRLKIDDKTAAEIINGYKKRFSGITTFLQECIEQARRFGYVETILKRRRPILDVDSSNPSKRALAERLAINTVVQGSAADLIKVAMVDIHRRILSTRSQDDRRAVDTLRGPNDGDLPPKGVRMLLQIHDELVFEAPEIAADEALVFVRNRMESAMKLSVPLKADAHVGRNWYEGK